MIQFFPYSEETMVVRHEWPEVLERLKRATAREGWLTRPPEERQSMIFAGKVEDDAFDISLKFRRPNSFMPKVTGRIEPVANGCLLFLSYNLYRVVKWYIVFWTIFIVCAGFVLMYNRQDAWMLAHAFALIVIIQLIIHANFRLQLKQTRKALTELFS